MRKLNETQTKQLIEYIAGHYVENAKMVYSRTRKREVVDARFMCFYVLRCFDFTYNEIANVFQCNHATVINGIVQVQNTLFLEKHNRQIAAKAITYTRKMLKSCEFNKNLWLMVGLLLQK